MNRYLVISRLRWPALLLLTGVIALLNQAEILSWGHAWPLYLILLGVLALAERASLASQPPPPTGYPYGAPGYPTPGYGPPAGPYAGGPGGPGQTPGAPSASTAPSATSTSIVPVQDNFDNRSIQPYNGKDEEGR